MEKKKKKRRRVSDCFITFVMKVVASINECTGRKNKKKNEEQKTEELGKCVSCSDKNV